MYQLLAMYHPAAEKVFHVLLLWNITYCLCHDLLQWGEHWCLTNGPKCWYIGRLELPLKSKSGVNCYPCVIIENRLLWNGKIKRFFSGNVLEWADVSWPMCWNICRKVCAIVSTEKIWILIWPLRVCRLVFSVRRWLEMWKSHRVDGTSPRSANLLIFLPFDVVNSFTLIPIRAQWAHWTRKLFMLHTA